MRSLRLLGTLAGVLLSSSSLAADIFAVPRTTGIWSNPAIWQGGLVPGAGDVAIANGGAITVDPAAPSQLGGWDSNTTSLILAKAVTFSGIGIRESSLIDGGFDLVVTDVLSNSGHSGGGSFNAGVLVREGGVLDVGHLDLGRNAGDFTFRPGDVVRGDYTTTRLFSAWPDISVVQDEDFYADNLGEGLSFEDPTALISLGRTSAVDQSSVTLSWDEAITGDIDWTLRWRGDHVAQMRTWHQDGQIIIGSTPAGWTFDARQNIFYDAASDYTYVGFFSTDGDGVCQPSDADDQDGDGYPDDCAPLGFSGLFPAMAGRPNGFVVWDATPGERYAVLLGFAEGSTPIPGCPGVAADMDQARVWYYGRGPADGTDAVKSNLPQLLAGRDTWVQIVEIGTCRLSERFIYAL
ncbi:MAG TPA: hypothetical protein PKA64_14050 [Myxococcota bacterium]|nr:hypothetical protein [Myxococcota bacterium]